MEAEIPVFDISEPSADLADKVVEAAGKYGFLFIKSTGIDFRPEDVSGIFSLAKTFFASPRSEKEACSMQPNNRGWTSMGSETLDPATQKVGDPKEAFNFGEFVDGRAQQPLPPAFRPHEAQLARFSSLCYGLSLKLLRLFAIGLKIEGPGPDPGSGSKSKSGPGSGGEAEGPSSGEEWFSSRHDPSRGDSGTILRLLHYPAAHGGAAIRAGAHSDYGSLTLLFRLPGQPGLEILTPSGRWAPVPVQPASTARDPAPPVLVNIGDLLSYWTGGLLKSTVHRVVGSGADDADASATAAAADHDRYSIAFFCHPCRDTALVPVPSPLVRERIGAGRDGSVGYGSGANAAATEAGGKVITAAQHLQGRLAATYGWDTGVQAS